MLFTDTDAVAFLLRSANIEIPKWVFHNLLLLYNIERTEGKWLTQGHRASSRPDWEENPGVLNYPSEFNPKHFPSAASWCVSSRGRVFPSQSGKVPLGEDIWISFFRMIIRSLLDERQPDFPSPRAVSGGEHCTTLTSPPQLKLN